jgi:hypothetical protein
LGLDRLRIALVGWLMAGACLVARAEAPAPRAGPSLGLVLRGEPPGAVLERPADEGGGAPVIRLTVSWSDVERTPGLFDWSGIEGAISALSQAGHPIALCLTHTSPLGDGSLDGWLGFVRGAVRTFAGKVAVYEVWDRPAASYDPALYAFVVKQSALVARAEAVALGHAIAVAQGAIEPSELEWQERVWALDTAAYLDILPTRVPVGEGAAELEHAITAVYAALLRHPPAPRLWAYVERRGGTPGAAALGAAVRALAAGAAVAVVDLAPEEPGRAEAALRWVVATDRVLARGFAPAPRGEIRIVDAIGNDVPGMRILGRFLSNQDFTTLAVYGDDGSGQLPAAEDVRVVLDTASVRDVRSLDPVAGRELRLAREQLGAHPGRTSLRVPVREYPMLLMFRRGVSTPGFDVPPAEVEVESVRGLTAEEIIACYQQVQTVQDDELERWLARGRIDFHFKLPQGGSTFDVTIDSNYFWERGGDVEWEQTDYYINGNRVGWKKIPELPLIQPEKVMTLPLDLTLDKTYGYRLVGEGEVEGRPAYVLAFEPVDPEAPRSQYRGRVWIDRETFHRLKVSLVQTRLGPPVLSNEEADLYRPHAGPQGTGFWLLSRIDGQQIWNAAGRNFVVRREVTLTSFEINPPRELFEDRRARAYASQHQMLRDTDQGFRYLERRPDGTRAVKQGVDTSQLFAAAGAFQDSSRDLTPLAGVNYFDYNLADRNVQLNALFAGAFAFVTASKPDLLGGRLDATAEATGLAVRLERKVFVAGEESALERLETRRQRLSVRLGLPLAQFFKLSVVGDFAYHDYAPAEVGRQAVRYRLPQDHLESTAALEVEFNRRGWTVAGEASWSGRSAWDAWGLRDGAGRFVRYRGGDPTDTASYELADPEPLRARFRRWGVTAFREWYLPAFQKVRGEVNYLDGADLDEFSRYEFGLFGSDRLNGFSGSGVRFDRGWIARAGYSFNLFEAIRLDATVDTARVDSPASGSQSFSGVGLSGNVVGPWKTVISLSYGIAVRSDIPPLEGEQEFLLLVLKLF